MWGGGGGAMDVCVRVGVRPCARVCLEHGINDIVILGTFHGVP